MAPAKERTRQQEAEWALTRANKQHEKFKLLERRERSIKSFDTALAELRCEKLKLEADLKTTDLRKLVLVQELHLLKEFEKNDIALAKRLEKKHSEKAEIVAKVAECQEKLAQKKSEIERLLEKDKQIMVEFHGALGENNKFYDVLLQIFKKKVKRVKRGGAESGDAEDFNSDEEDEDEDGLDSGDELDEEEEEVCPPGCDPALYEKVCELREKRLEQEEFYAEFQKGVEVLKKDNDNLIKKEKVIDKALRDTEGDIQAFQTDNQRKLNELHVVVMLQMRQVQHLVAVEGREAPAEQLPTDTTASLVFASSELKKLKLRIQELQVEKAELRRKQKALRSEHVVLSKDQAVKRELLNDLEARAYDVQMLKFGQVINLEAIENAAVNKGAEELKERVRQLEAQQDRALQVWQNKLRQAKLEMKNATEASTNCLNSVANLFQKQHSLEAALNSRSNATVATSEESAEPRERHRLVQLVKIQAKEVEALKLEIKMLRRKGGHVYSAPQPPAGR